MIEGNSARIRAVEDDIVEIKLELRAIRATQLRGPNGP